MDRGDLAARLEAAVRGPSRTPGDVRAAMDGALGAGTGVCVPPCYADTAAEYAPDVPLTVEVDAPTGHLTRTGKAEAAVEAWEAGADRIDVMANAGLLRAEAGDAFEADVEEVVAAVPVPVTVIVETRLLGEAALREGCERAAAAGADGLRTSTGFGDGGADPEDVALMAEYLPVTASGDIDTAAAARERLEAGAERINTPSADAVLGD